MSPSVRWFRKPLFLCHLPEIFSNRLVRRNPRPSCLLLHELSCLSRRCCCSRRFSGLPMTLAITSFYASFTAFAFLRVWNVSFHVQRLSSWGGLNLWLLSSLALG